MPNPKISTYREITAIIYSWRTPDVQKYDGWEKIGYTEQESLTSDSHRRPSST